MQPEVLDDAQLFVETEALRHVAAGNVDGVVVLDHIEAGQPDAATIGYQQSGHDPHQRSFAGASLTQQGVNLTLFQG